MDSYYDLILGEVRDAALQYAMGGGAAAPYDAISAASATASNAVVVCGYGEMGQRACDVLADAEGVGGGAAADVLRDQVALPSGAWGVRAAGFDPARRRVLRRNPLVARLTGRAFADRSPACLWPADAVRRLRSQPVARLDWAREAGPRRLCDHCHCWHCCHSFHNIVTLLSHYCHTTVTPLSHHCHTTVTPLSHTVTQLLSSRYTTVALWQHST